MRITLQIVLINEQITFQELAEKFKKLEKDLAELKAEIKVKLKELG